MFVSLECIYTLSGLQFQNRLSVCFLVYIWKFVDFSCRRYLLKCDILLKAVNILVEIFIIKS